VSLRGNGACPQRTSTSSTRKHGRLVGSSRHAAARRPAIPLDQSRLQARSRIFSRALSSRKRKTLRRERREAQEGLEIVRASGADLKPQHWDAFFRFYMDTGGRKWGSPYLNREFFQLLHERMADKCLLILAMDDGKNLIAGALNLIGSDTLYGRYWGREIERPFLHFEISYYQAIDFAIERGLALRRGRRAGRAQADARV
jgi:predicted N-acyltransferase